MFHYAIIFILGTVEGLILMDSYRDKMALRSKHVKRV